MCSLASPCFFILIGRSPTASRRRDVHGEWKAKPDSDTLNAWRSVSEPSMKAHREAAGEMCVGLSFIHCFVWTEIPVASYDSTPEIAYRNKADY